MALERRPLTGLRLAYRISMGGEQFRVSMKESVGNWLGLTPVDSSTEGTFGIGPNAGKKFLNRAPGFRFQSFTFLVKPGTKISVPVNTGTCKSTQFRDRQICSFTIGFPKGKVISNGAIKTNVNITRWRVKSWARGTKRAGDIIGMITPSGNRHIWKGQKGQGLIPDIGFPGFPGVPELPSLPELIELGTQLGPLLLP